MTVICLHKPSTLSMDALLLYSLLLSSLSLLLYGVVTITYSIWWKPKWLERQLNQQGIRGTPYKLLVGDMTELLKQMKAAWSKPISLNHNIVARVYPFSQNNVQKYGKISMFWAGKTPRVIIKDLQMMKEVLSNKQGHFGKPHLNTLILILTRGLTTLEGEAWTKRRRILNPAFHTQKLKGMVPYFSISCNLMIEQWKKMTSDNGTGELDIWPELQKLTADIILRAALGSSYEEGKNLFGLQKELITLVLESMQTIHIPGFRFLPTKKNRKIKKLVKEITSIMKDLIQRKQNAIRSGQSKADDLLSLLLQCTEENSMTQITNGTKGAEMTIEEVMEECKQFYLAGQETTASLITWTMIVLAMHPDWQQRTREEVLQVCGKKDTDFEAISDLKTVTMILYEVLRLYPPAIAIYMHTYKKTNIGDISIPAGVDITLPTILIHHDPELWGDDSEEFKPERFSEGVSKASKDQLAFFPFGWGPRTCIGLNFAMIEAKMTLAVILQHFSFGLSPSYTHAPYTVLTLQPQHGAQITLHQL